MQVVGVIAFGMNAISAPRIIAALIAVILVFTSLLTVNTRVTKFGQQRLVVQELQSAEPQPDHKLHKVHAHAAQQHNVLSCS